MKKSTDAEKYTKKIKQAKRRQKIKKSGNRSIIDPFPTFYTFSIGE